MCDCISLMAVLGGLGVYLHPPFQPHITGPQSGVGNGQLKQLLPGMTVQIISTLAQLKPCPCLQIYGKTNMMLHTV